jgi:hypothetical protein
MTQHHRQRLDASAVSRQLRRAVRILEHVVLTVAGLRADPAADRHAAGDVFRALSSSTRPPTSPRTARRSSTRTSAVAGVPPPRHRHTRRGPVMTRRSPLL